MKTAIVALLCLIMISILISCNPPRNTYSSDQVETRSTPKILFLNYQISRDSTSETFDAQLISMMIVEGSIKEDQSPNTQAEKGDLELLVLDSNQQIMTHHHIPNPLDKSVEYVNNTGQFERQMIHLDSTQFSIRLQVESSASSILLKRTIDDNTEGTLLLNTQIR